MAVSGRVERFRDELQIELTSIRRAEAADPAAFLPTAYRDLDELDGFLEHLAREVYDADLRALLDAFLGDDELPRGAAPGALHSLGPPRLPRRPAGAHRGRGTLALETCALHPRLNSDVLISAALLHDVGKLREFELGAEIAFSEAGTLVGHVALGQQMIVERAAGLDAFPEEKLQRRCCTACWPITAPTPCRAGASAPLRRWLCAPQRARRRRQGRARTRPGLTFRPLDACPKPVAGRS